MASRNFRSKKHWWLSYREKIFFLCVLAIFFVITPQKQGETVVAAFPELQTFKREILPIPSPHPYPMNISKREIPPDITASSIMVVDPVSGVTLFAKNEAIPMPPASTTKIMTAIVALDVYNPADIVTYQGSTVSGQLMDLVVGERMTIENLLYGLLIQSGNDAATALANHHDGGYAGFIDAMNAKAAELHLDSAHFTNPVGYDDPNQKMSARDLVRLSRYGMNYPLIGKIVAIPQITISDADYTIYHNLKNINQLLGKVKGVSGIKTGWTEEAGENLVTMVERDGKKVIIVVLKSADRFSDTIKIIDWVFGSFQWVTHGV